MSSAGHRREAGHWTLSPEALGHFLLLLDADIVKAGQKYERLRLKLIRLFEWRGCVFADDLADETINRVVRKIEGGVDLADGEVPRYSAAVAHFVFLEHLREVKRRLPAPGDAEMAPWVLGRHQTTDLRLAILETCLTRLSAQDRDLILRYYSEDRGSRIANRRQLAKELGITADHLRIRAYRIRSRLESRIETRVSRQAEVHRREP